MLAKASSSTPMSMYVKNVDILSCSRLRYDGKTDLAGKTKFRYQLVIKLPSQAISARIFLKLFLFYHLLAVDSLVCFVMKVTWNKNFQQITLKRN